MSTTLNDSFWLEWITQCRPSGLTDHQWCIENGIPVSTFYYHVRGNSVASIPRLSVPPEQGASAQEIFRLYTANLNPIN